MLKFNEKREVLNSETKTIFLKEPSENIELKKYRVWNQKYRRVQ